MEYANDYNRLRHELNGDVPGDVPLSELNDLNVNRGDF